MRQAVGFFVLTGALIGWFQLEAPAGLNTEVNSVPELATQPSPLADNDEKNGSPKVVPDAKQMPEPRNEPKRREKWAVVQIYDARADVEAAAAILSTHEALRELGMLRHVTHVAYVALDPYGSAEDKKVNGTPPVELFEEGHYRDPSHSASLALLVEAGIQLITTAEVAPPVEKIEKNANRFAEADRFHRYFYKLTLFGMTQFDRVLFLDNDIVVVQDMLGLLRRSQAIDELRNEDQFTASAQVSKNRNRKSSAVYASADSASGMCYNSGVMVFVPNLADMTGILDIMAKSPKGAWLSTCTGNAKPSGDQELIFFYFQSQKRLEALPPYYNTLLSHHGHDELNGPEGWVVGMPTATKYVKWAMHDWRSRASIHAVHVAWPKPTWPMWSPDNFNQDEDILKEERAYRKSQHFPTTGVWAEHPAWFFEYARQGEPGLSFLALFKTFWAREARILKQLCKRVKTDGNRQTNITLKNFHRSGKMGKQQVQFLVPHWCESTQAQVNSGDDVIYPSEHMFIFAKKVGFLKNKEVPLWSETLQPSYSAKAQKLEASARAAQEEEAKRSPQEIVSENPEIARLVEEAGVDPEGDDGLPGEAAKATEPEEPDHDPEIEEPDENPTDEKDERSEPNGTPKEDKEEERSEPIGSPKEDKEEERSEPNGTPKEDKEEERSEPNGTPTEDKEET